MPTWISCGAPHEIQVGILKRLRVAPIARHTARWRMIYDPQPPYEILQNGDLGFAVMHCLRRFARYWDLIANSGRFVATAPLIWKDSSPFREFLAFSDWLYAETGSTHGIALPRLARLLEEYLREKKGVSDLPASAARSEAAGPRAGKRVTWALRRTWRYRRRRWNPALAATEQFPSGNCGPIRPIRPIDFHTFVGIPPLDPPM